MHGNLYRISVHQSLNTFGLVSVGQLVCCVNVDFYFTSGRLFHQFTEFSSTLCPGTGFCGGTGEVPGLFFPAKITVICDVIIRISGTTGAVLCIICTVRRSRYRSAVSTIFSGQCFRQKGGYSGNIGDQ